MKFLANLILNFNQLISAILHRVTTATIATLITTRAQIAYNDDVNKIIYNDGTAVQTVASESYVTGQVSSGALTIAPASASRLDITSNQLSLKALAIQKVNSDSTSATLTAALAARTPVYNATNVGNGTADLQEGDVLILAAATGGQQVYIQNGGTAGTIADFTIMEQPQINNATIRALLSAVNGLTYDSATGIFKLGGGLIDASTVISLTNNNTAFEVSSVGVYFRLNRGTTSRVITLGNNFGDFLRISDNAVAFTIGSGASAPITDVNASPKGFEYAANYAATFSARSLVDKAYADSVGAKRSTQTVTTVANTFLTITHGFALADANSIQVALWEAGKMVLAEVETVDGNSIRIRTGSAITGLKVFLIA